MADIEEELTPPTEQELQELKAIKEARRRKKDVCSTCDKVVYATEKMQVDDLLLHKNCFRCEECNNKLTLSNFAAVNSKLYCKTHYLSLFASSGGSYEVFGDAGFKKGTNRRAEAGKVVSGREGTHEVEETVSLNVQLKPTPVLERQVEEKQEIKVSLRPTPKTEKPKIETQKPEKIELKPTPKLEKKKEEFKPVSVNLKPTPKVEKEVHAGDKQGEKFQVPLKHPKDTKVPSNSLEMQPAGDDTTSALSLLTKSTYARFLKINSASLKEQKDFFVFRFIFTLELSGTKHVEAIAGDFKDASDSSDQFQRNPEFSMFINNVEKKYDLAFTSKKYRDVVFNSLDLDGNGKISFLEYLLFTYKKEIIDEHYMRQGLDTPKKVNFSNAKLGKILIEELFEPPAGVDEKLDAVYQEYMREKRDRENKIRELREKLKTLGRVKGMGVKKELEELEKEAAENEENVLINAGVRRVKKKQRIEYDDIYATLSKSS